MQRFEPSDRLRSILRHDLPASLVVFLVALPLSLGIAIASNAPVLAGLIAAIVGGIIVGAIGGSPLQVSGPAAGLTVVVADLISDFGWGVTCLITAAAGVLQVLLGLSRVARAALAISPVVVHAMLAGIGITIALQQAHVLLGGKSKSTAWHNVIELPVQVIGAHRPGVLLGVLVIAILIAWRWVPAKLAARPGTAGRHRRGNGHLGGLSVSCEADRPRRLATGCAAAARNSRRQVGRGRDRASSPSRSSPASRACCPRFRSTGCTTVHAPTSTAS